MPGDRRPTRRRPTSPLVALAASLAVHLALLVALVRSGQGRTIPPRAERAPLRVELRAAPAVRPGTKQVPPPRPAAPPPRSKRAVAATAPSAAPAAGPAAPAAPSPDAGRLAGLALAPEDRASGRGERGAAPDLHVRWPGIATSPGAAGGQGDARAADDALRAWTRELAGRARVDGGLVHPYYRDVGRALLRAWDAEGAVKRGGLAGYLSNVGDNLVAFGRVWQRLADGYGKTGAPAAIDGGSDRMKELSGLPPGPARDALVAKELQRQLRPVYSEGHVATVRVTQALTGGLLSIELVSPSRDPELDRAALDGVREAARALPVPPPEARAGRDALVSTWEFELEISIAPPIPMVALEFDEVLGASDLRVPLDRRVWKRVRLVSLN